MHIVHEIERKYDGADSEGGHCHEEHRISSYVRVEKFDYVMTRYLFFFLYACELWKIWSVCLLVENLFILFQE